VARRRRRADALKAGRTTRGGCSLCDSRAVCAELDALIKVLVAEGMAQDYYVTDLYRVLGEQLGKQVHSLTTLRRHLHRCRPGWNVDAGG